MGEGVRCVPGRGLYGRVLICTIFDKYPLDEVQNNVIFYLIFGVFWQFYVIFIVYLLFFLDFAVVLFGDLSKILNKHGFNSRFPSLANQISVFVVLYGDLAKILNKHGFNSRFPSLANQISVFVANEWAGYIVGFATGTSDSEGLVANPQYTILLTITSLYIMLEYFAWKKF